MKTTTNKHFSLSAITKSFSRLLKGIFFTSSHADFKRLKNFIC